MPGTWPASPFQHTIMTNDATIPSGSTGPHMTMAISVLVTGGLDVDLLDAAYDDLVARNDVLRTTVEPDGAQWVQRVHPHRAAHLERAVAKASEAQSFVDAWTREPVPIDHPPLVRGQVVALDDGTHLISLVFHHLHTDPPSLVLAVAELGALYTARLSGTPLPPPPLQYGPYSARRAEITAPTLDADREHWREVVDGARPLDLATTRDWSTPPRSGVLRLEVLDARETAALEKWSLRSRTTLFASLFTAFCLAAADRSTTRDVLVNTVFEQRAHPDVRTLIGPFLHPSVLRVRVPEGATWSSLTPVVRDAVMAAHARAHVPGFDVLRLHPDVIRAVETEPVGLCVFQYLPYSGLEDEFAYGPATARVLAKTEAGPTGDVGLMFRLHRRSSGSLHATVTYDRRDLAEDLVRALFADFAAGLREPLATPVA
ncbi:MULTISPECIES: condensation domain-containing protein [Actinosynnema]|uniref:condensation domain-containing protein n=1 Tax=Actinosynnema TaxID=40566 RepID=UPI0020A46298|nr:condensation domain-containing protein [Actinosynnema pretiosum]MCP2094343.1 Condensation domain-containing protein [Actinosynnema pretiosum]